MQKLGYSKFLKSLGYSNPIPLGLYVPGQWS